MALENDPSSKMQIKSLGELLHPGHCFSCGNGTFEGNYLDLGVFFDYEGQMYLCETCGIQIGETLGMFTVEEHLKLMKEAGDALNALDKLQEEYDNVRNQLAAARTLLGSLPAINRSASDSASKKSEERDEVSDESATEADTGEPETTEPAVSAGPTDTSGPKPGDRIFS